MYEELVQKFKAAVERDEVIINTTEEWTPKLQMLVEQHYVRKIMIEALETELPNSES